MKLDQITLHVVEMELVSPFETSFGREVKRPAIIVEVRADGLTGWGECVAGSGPWYGYETVGTARHVFKDFLISLLLNAEWSEPQRVPDLLRPVRGHNMTKAALESACWDVWCQAQNVSLSKALGGTRAEIASGVSVGIQPNVDELIAAIEAYRSKGYGRVKIKIKPGWDEEVVAAVRKAFSDVDLQVDANAAYTLNDTEHLKKLDAFGLLMIEQPLGYDDLADHAKLQAQLSTPICLDESLKTRGDVDAMLALGSGRVVNIKVGRVGGLTNAVAIHDLAQSHQLPVWCGGMLETGVGRAANVALASLPGFSLANDLSASDRYFHQDLIDPPFVLNNNGTLSVPTGLGLGVTLNREALDGATTHRETYIG